MTPDEELELVRKAILMGKTVTGCFEWHERAWPRVQNNPDLLRLTPGALREIAIAFVEEKGTIHQVKESRPEFDDFDYYYKIVVDVTGFSRGVFFEMRLTDPDEECPTVLLVNAHPQLK